MPRSADLAVSPPGFHRCRAAARKAVVEAFGAGGDTYGHRRIAAKKKRRHSSYEGEISEAPRACCATRGQAPLRGRRAQRAADHRCDRVPRPRRQGVPLAHRGLLRRHAAELVDIGLARRRDGELAPDRRVRVAQRREAIPRRTRIEAALSLAGMDKDLQGQRPGLVDVEEGAQPR